MLITNKEYKINSRINTNIVLISDIHYYSKKDIKYLNKILDKITRLKPNYICIPGDIIDECNIEDEKYFIEWLTKLSNITKTIISLGNHEYYIDKRKNLYGFNKELFQKIKKINNIYLLDNENVIIDDINFIGLTLNKDYYYKHYEDYDNFFKSINSLKINTNYYNILLCHSPVNVTNEKVIEKLNVDLILCGHTHGGMVPKIFRKIIKNDGFISPNKKLFPKKVYGNLKIKNTNIIITSGITVLSHTNRFYMLRHFFSGEIVNIKLTKSK